jgi:hypothetical protein
MLIDTKSRAGAGGHQDVRRLSGESLAMFGRRKKPTEVTPQDRLARSQTRAAWLSALGALLSIPLSLVALYQSHQAKVESAKEEVAASFHRYIGDYPMAFHDWHGGSYIPGTISTLWETIIANNGDRPVSIVTYDVKTVIQEGPVSYSGLDLGLFDSELKPERLPLNLAPGTSVKLFLRIGTIVGQNAYGHLKRFSATSSSFTLRAVEKDLADQGTDLFDNRVTPMREAGAVVGWKVEPPIKHQPEVALVIRTARGSALLRTASWYDFSSTLPLGGALSSGR